MKSINATLYLLLFFMYTSCVHGMESNKRPETPIKNTSEEKKPCVPCPICGRMFKSYGILDNHLPTHDMNRPYKCSLCRVGFISENGLSDHLGTKAHKQKASFGRKKPALSPVAEALLELSGKQS